MDTLPDTPQSIQATINYDIADFPLEICILHPWIVDKGLVDPVLIGIGKRVQFPDGIFLFGFCRHGKRREKVSVETIKGSTHAREFIFRYECRSDRCSSSVNWCIPYRSTSSAASQDRTLFKVEFICCKDFSADMLRNKSSRPIFGICFQLHLEHNGFYTACRILSFVYDIGCNKRVTAFQSNPRYMHMNIGIADKLIFLCTSEISKVDMNRLRHRDAGIDCTTVFFFVFSRVFL